MKGYGKRRHWACCPGHDADWKHTRKRAVRKASLRAVKKTARQQGKTEALRSNDEYCEIMDQICDLPASSCDESSARSLISRPKR